MQKKNRRDFQFSMKCAKKNEVEFQSNEIISFKVKKNETFQNNEKHSKKVKINREMQHRRKPKITLNILKL